jgi:hypothetical protein
MERIKINKIIYVFIIFFLTSCVQEEETPTKLFSGNYSYNKDESLNLLNDSILVMKVRINKGFVFDTLKFKYIPPVLNDEFVSVGNLYFISRINSKSKLHEYCNKMNIDEEHLIYTLRYGKYMLLPNPESTDFSYELIE